jgi:hypothetical protein
MEGLGGKDRGGERDGFPAGGGIGRGPARSGGRSPAPRFTQPVSQIVTMLLVAGLTAAGAWLAMPSVAPVFLTNPLLNGFIGGVFLIGVLSTFWQVFQLIGSVRWIEGFAAQRPGQDLPRPPQLLVPLAALLRDRGARVQISASSSRSILDSVGTRIDEAREITRYLGTLLIFLGLLGTFYGLATTVPAVVETIRSLNAGPGESPLDVFARLMAGLEGQLGGMGTAFSSSLLGLSGSLVVGLLELFAGHGQNRFYRELEEWLSSITKLGLAGADGDGAGAAGDVAGVLDRMAAQMEALETIFLQSEQGRAALDDRIATLAAAVERIADGMAAQDGRMADALARFAGSQDRMAAAIEAATAGPATEPAEAASEAEQRMRLRSIDVQLLRILEEISAGRQESIAEIRADLATLTRALRSISVAEHSGAATPRRP